MRACIYARFSTDKQRETSIEDQARVCRDRIAAEGWTLGELYSDSQVSGRSLFVERPGAARMLADALAGKFDVLVVESLQRPFRDLVDQETIVRRLEHRRLLIIGVSDGYDSRREGRALMRAVHGGLNEDQLRDIARKVHRGLVGQIERGYHAGGISYGYTSVVAGLDAKGLPIGHHLAIDAERAEWVRWIYARYAEGWSCQRIAAELNRVRAPSPRGGTWCVSALYGAPNKGSGVLNNEIYIGRYIWNRSQWLKDPDTRRRQRIVRPRHEWKIDNRPELRIVDDLAWQRVRARMDGTRLAGGGRGRGARPQTLLGGFMKCGRCGGPVIAVSQWTYGCANHKNRGAVVCAGVSVNREIAERRLLTGIRETLLAPDFLADLQSRVRAELAGGQTQSRDRAREAETRRRELEREIGNLVDAVAHSGTSEALRARLSDAEAQLDRLRQASVQRPAAAQIDGARILAEHRQCVLDLQGTLRHDVPRARDILRAQPIGEVTLIPNGKEVWAEFSVDADRMLLAAGGPILGLVAGIRIPTQNQRIRLR